MTFVLGVIPARGGSKGIPKKNILPVGGKPLIGHTISAALDCRGLNDCIVSTDSQEIADCAASLGMPVHSLRGEALAADTTTTEDTVIYEVEKYEKETGQTVDVIVLLQPTAPMRLASDIDAALARFFDTGSTSLISVYEADFVHPSIMYFQKKGKLTPVLDEGKTIQRRQKFESVYVRNGALYITTRDHMFGSESFVDEAPSSYVMPWERSVNIDEPFDLEIAEWLMSRNA
jgi:CMP-N,N'-diacetyllegionaminic acid synthase